MNVKELFLNDSTLVDHYNCQESRYKEYIVSFLLLTFKYKVPSSLIQRARILASVLMRNDKQFAEFLLHQDEYDLPVILKTCQILDSRRLIAQMKRKTHRINKRRLSAHNSIIANLERLNEGMDVSLSKSKIKFIIKEWINKLSVEKLAMIALQFPKQQWRSLLNLLHTRDDDFQLEWFTAYIFDKEVPEDAIVSRFATLDAETALDIISEYEPSFSYLRIQHRKLLDDPQIIKILAEYTEMDQLLHHWDIFSVEQDQITDRLRKEKTDMLYGALMLHLLNLESELPVTQELMKIAIERLASYEIDIEHPVTVLADASASMNVAIRTSTIITSILCTLFSAKLHLFRGHDEPIENPPRSVEEVLKMGSELSAGGSTAPASSLWTFLQKKEVCKTFIIVTDEEENTGYDGEWTANPEKRFATVYKQYREKIYPAKLVFVSFLPDRRDGQMVRELKEQIPEIDEDLVQFILDKHKPDLRKLDDLLNKLTLETMSFQKEYEQMLGSFTENIGINGGWEYLHPTVRDDTVNKCCII